MLNYQILFSNRYESPYGSVKLQENIKNKIKKNQEADTFSSKTAETVKKVGSAALGIGAIIAGCVALIKNKK